MQGQGKKWPGFCPRLPSHLAPATGQACLQARRLRHLGIASPAHTAGRESRGTCDSSRPEPHTGTRELATEETR